MDFVKRNLGVSGVGDVDILSSLGQGNNSNDRPIPIQGGSGPNGWNNNQNIGARPCNSSHMYNKYGGLVQLAKYRHGVLDGVREEKDEGNIGRYGSDNNNNNNNNNQKIKMTKMLMDLIILI